MGFVSLDTYKQRISYNADNQDEYIGECQPGINESGAGWRIKKVSYSGGLITQIDWANGNANFDKSWTDRATYNYS